MHDALSLGHSAPLLFEYDNDAERRRDHAFADQLEGADATMGSAIALHASERAAVADVRLARTRGELVDVDAQVDDCRAELRGDAPYEESIWRAPERIAEPGWRTALRRWSVVLVLLPAELGINMLALQLLPGRHLDRDRHCRRPGPSRSRFRGPTCAESSGSPSGGSSARPASCGRSRAARTS